VRRREEAFDNEEQGNLDGSAGWQLIGSATAGVAAGVVVEGSAASAAEGAGIRGS
jgi:hypothetical protein